MDKIRDKDELIFLRQSILILSGLIKHKVECPTSNLIRLTTNNLAVVSSSRGSVQSRARKKANIRIQYNQAPHLTQDKKSD